MGCCYSLQSWTWTLQVTPGLNYCRFAHWWFKGNSSFDLFFFCLQGIKSKAVSFFVLFFWTVPPWSCYCPVVRDVYAPTLLLQVCVIQTQIRARSYVKLAWTLLQQVCLVLAQAIISQKNLDLSRGLGQRISPFLVLIHLNQKSAIPCCSISYLLTTKAVSKRSRL